MLVEIGGKVREKVDLGVLQVVLGESWVVLGGNQVVLGGNRVVLGANSSLTEISGCTLCW